MVLFRESRRIKKLSEDAVCLDEEAKTLQDKVDGADRIMSFEAKATARRRYTQSTHLRNYISTYVYINIH